MRYENFRTGNKEVDEYIESLELQISSFGSSNTKRLIKSIDGMAGKIADNIDKLSEGVKTAEGDDFEIDKSNLDAFIKMVDKCEKIQKFIEVADSIFGDKPLAENKVESIAQSQEEEEHHTISNENMFEKTLRAVRAK